MSFFGRYPREARNIAHEILQYLEDDTAEAIARQILKDDARSVFFPPEAQLRDALDFLEKTPSQRDRKIKILDRETILLLLQARFLGLLAEENLRAADDASLMKGASYRRLTRYFAERFLDVGDAYDIDKILPVRNSYGEYEF